MAIRTIVLLIFTLITFDFPAQAGITDTYTKENPLVYEDLVNQWPFSFINEAGEPDGFNIDLLKMLMKELHIPYVIRLKSKHEVLQDLKSKQSDLVLGPTAAFYHIHNLYGRNTIILLTQSVATPKHRPVAIETFRDLGLKDQKVFVNDSSLCHHLMVDYGWTGHAIPSTDMSKTILEVNAKQEGQIVWNTISLKWLINHYQLDNLKLTPVNMPHGEYKYMSNDRQLLELVEKAYAQLSASGKITPLEKKWFYPMRKAPEKSNGKWYLAALGVLLVALAIIYMVRVVAKKRHTIEAYDKLGLQLAQVAEDGHVRIWTYDVRERVFVWHHKDGKAMGFYSMERFATRYSKEDYKLLKEALDRLISQHKDEKGHEETEETIELKARDTENDDKELHDFVVVLSVLEHDANGKPTIIIGTKRDVTRECRLKRMNTECSLRYWSVFYNDVSGVIHFDREGYIKNANPKACELLVFDVDEAVEERVHLNKLLRTEFSELPGIDGVHGLLEVGEHRVEYQIKTVYNDQGELTDIFVFCL